MTATQRRKAVEVARDVLLQLRLKRFTTGGGYLSLIDARTEESFCLTEDNEGSFQKTFKENKAFKCKVCAIGAAYVSFINRFNKVTNEEVLGACDDDMIETLSAVFTNDQLRLMEAAFEGTIISTPEWLDNLCSEDFDGYSRLRERLQGFYRHYKTDDERLRAIMLNVIRNSGEFRIPLRVR